MNAEAIKSCPKCQAPIQPEAPQGLCPKCLLSAASIPTEAGQPAEQAALPSLESIAAGFPQLEILEFIGQGGMGIVFKARQPKLDRFVALKLLPQKPGADPSFCERFNREARVLARLSHPNIVAVHDFGEAGPFFYLLMEFVDGVNLRQAMQAGRFTPAQALALVPKICDALQYAHEEGILHRDIKPENLLLDSRGRVKIADFGIAKLLGESKDITLTGRGAAIGTPHYMAPEQLERPQDVDQRADVYSLGVVFYEMLTGELPIGRFAPPSEKAPMDPRVDQVVLRTLEKERERRFQSAGDVKTQVEKITSTPAADAPQRTGAVKLEDGSKSPEPYALPARALAQHSAWSWRDFFAIGLVGFSLLLLGPAMMAGLRHGPLEVSAFLSLVVCPGLAGTVLAWATLLSAQSRPDEPRGGRLLFLSAVAWPLLLLNLVLLLIMLLFVKSLPWHVIHLQSGGVVGVVAAIGVLAFLGLDGFFVRQWMKRWTSDRALPHTEVRAFLSRFSRRARWSSAIALCLLLVLLLASQGQIQGTYEAPQPAALVPELNAPPGFELAPGGAPGNDGRLYRSMVSVPPGYALTLSVVLFSNQVVLREVLTNTTAVLMAPEGPTLSGQLTWRLLGNTTFADGAPIQFSFNFPQGAEHTEKSFHIIPPEPITIDWVAEPAQVWPPQNGHTRFLILRGSSPNATAEVQPSVEWSLGVEARLDPIPADLLQSLKSPVINLGATSSSTQEKPVEN